MSIATDEAEKKYPVPTDADDPMYKYVESIAGYPSAKRQGYIAGRTAEPTEAEIKAAAKRIFIFLNGPWQGKHYELSYVDSVAIADAAWETADKRRYEACAEFALKAARKEVAE